MYHYVGRETVRGSKGDDAPEIPVKNIGQVNPSPRIDAKIGIRSFPCTSIPNGA